METNKPSYLGLLNAIALGEGRAHQYLSCWAAKTTDPDVKKILQTVAIYANFFTHHFVPDVRWYLATCALGLYSRTTVIYRPLDRDRTMPLLVAFLLIGFFIWLAENFSTFFGVWRYPDQLGAWTSVHVGKWSSWSLLVIMTFTIVANLKHIKERIHVPA
jgi:uncharacterized membrane protein YoaT (DUF817 family)